MRFDVLTLFPEIFQGYLGQSLLKRAIDAGLVEVRLHDIRDWSKGKHNTVDDRPFGGGPGMVMKVEPAVECVEAVQADGAEPGRLVMLTPQGRRLDQPKVEELARQRRILLLCGRYEGFDERIRLILEPDEISIGDYVLNGGEVAAMTIIDATIRLVPGVLGDEDSSADDSFSGTAAMARMRPIHPPAANTAASRCRRSCWAAITRRSTAGGKKTAASEPAATRSQRPAARTNKERKVRL